MLAQSIDEDESSRWREVEVGGNLDDEELLNMALLSLVLDRAVPRSVAEGAGDEPHDGYGGFERAWSNVSTLFVGSVLSAT